MAKILRKSAVLLFLTLFLALSLSQVSVVYAAEQYDMRGAYNEAGARDGAINCTFYRTGEAPYTFELDGQLLVNASDQGELFEFDIGYNESRIYYVYQNETVYVIKPSDPYYTYFFDVVDYVGLQWGFIESLLNINGTETVVERWDIFILNDIPFTFTWGTAYKMRLVCDRGEYVYGSYVAGATTSFTLAVTSDMFPIPRTDIRDLTVSASRQNESWIQCVYIDANVTTNWVNFDIHEYGNTTALYSYNTTSNSVIFNWYEGAAGQDYYVVITIDHQNLGTKYWTYPCPAPVDPVGNPFAALRLLGDFPIDPAQVPPIALVMVVFLVFSWWNAPMGIIAGLIISFVFAWMGWLAIGWTWLTIAGSIGVILAIAMAKEREVRMR